MNRRNSKRWMRSLRKNPRSRLFSYLYFGAFILALLSFVWGVYRVVEHAETTERFEIRKISVWGMNRVSEAEILSRSGYTTDSNVLRVNLEQARIAIEGILWLRHATVQRVWPDEVVITVVEREAIALARIDGEIYQVDVEGIILSTDARTDASFPILDGLRPGDVEGNKKKIDSYNIAIEAIGQSNLSEVHVSDIGEISVVPTNNSVVIDLGSADYGVRWEKYVQFQSRILEDYPSAFHIDLRFQDQVIIRTEENKPAEGIIWGEEKKLL